VDAGDAAVGADQDADAQATGVDHRSPTLARLDAPTRFHRGQVVLGLENPAAIRGDQAGDVAQGAVVLAHEATGGDRETAVRGQCGKGIEVAIAGCEDLVQAMPAGVVAGDARLAGDQQMGAGGGGLVGEGGQTGDVGRGLPWNDQGLGQGDRRDRMRGRAHLMPARRPATG